MAWTRIPQIRLITWTIVSGKVPAVRFLLDIGATVLKHTTEEKLVMCETCEKIELTLYYK